MKTDNQSKSNQGINTFTGANKMSPNSNLSLNNEFRVPGQNSRDRMADKINKGSSRKSF